MKPFLGFDIETARPVPESRVDEYTLGITCAAMFSPGAFGGNTPDLWTWRSGMPESDQARYPDEMDIQHARGLARSLVSLAEDFQIVTVNGVSFDLRVLAEECIRIDRYGFSDIELYHQLQVLAWEQYDPCFEMVCRKGYPVGLKAMAEGWDLEQKTMDGLEAIEKWLRGTRADQEQVLEYVEQDARLTYQIADLIKREGVFRWVTKKGQNRQLLSRPRTARESWKWPRPNMSWWTGGAPPAREDFADWILPMEAVFAETDGYAQIDFIDSIMKD